MHVIWGSGFKDRSSHHPRQIELLAQKLHEAQQSKLNSTFQQVEKLIMKLNHKVFPSKTGI